MTRILALAFVALTLGAVVYYGFVTAYALPDHPLIRGKNDLVLHTAAFAVLLITLGPLVHLWVGILITTTLALAVEAIQTLIPGRTASLSDVLAGFVGIAIASLLVWTVQTLILRRRRRVASGSCQGIRPAQPAPIKPKIIG